MSGEFFDYENNNLTDFSDAINKVIDPNGIGVSNEFGQLLKVNHIPIDVIEYMKYASLECNKLAHILHDIDLYLSGDTSEASEASIRSSNTYKRFFGKKQNEN